MNRFAFEERVATQFVPHARNSVLVTNLSYPAEHPYHKVEHAVTGTLELHRYRCLCGWDSPQQYRSAKSTQTFTDAGLLAWRQHLSGCPLSLISYLRRRSHLHLKVATHAVSCYSSGRQPTDKCARAIHRAIMRAGRWGHLLMITSDAADHTPL